jgi:tetratricopeptide (TPR) repeat protein
LEPIKISDRLKYYRNILNIGQKALVDENISINLIKYVEGGKRRLTIHKAMILADKFNVIAREKKIELNLTARDLLMTDEEYAQKICLDELIKIDEKIYDEEKYNEILSIAQEYNLDEVIVEVYEKIGKFYYSIRDFSNAIKYYEHAMELITKVGDQDKKAKILNSLGVCYYMIEEYTKALEIYNQCYIILLNDKVKDNKLESKLLYNLALCSRKLKRESEVSEFLEKLLLMEDFDELAVINGLILKANICLDNEQYEEALQLYKSICAYGPKYIYIIQNNIAHAFFKLNRIEESIEYLTKSITEQLEEPTPILTISLVNMGLVYNNENLYNPAITFFEYAINNALKFHQIDLIAECCENLFILYNKTDKAKKFDKIIIKIAEFRNNYVIDEYQNKLISKMLEKYSGCINK